MPLLERFVVVSCNNVAILVDWQIRQGLIQLDKGVMSVRQHTNRVPFEVSDVLEEELA